MTTPEHHRALADTLVGKSQRCEALADSIDVTGRQLSALPNPVLVGHTSAVWNSRAAERARDDLRANLGGRFDGAIDRVHAVARRLREQADEHTRAATRHRAEARQLDQLE